MTDRRVRLIARRGAGLLVVISLVAGVMAAGPALGAKKPLTKGKALKLFYPKSAADDRFVEEAETFTGTFSCAGTSWQTGESGDEFNANGPLRQPTAEGVFAGVVFICNVVLPEGATIMAVRYSVQDTSATDQVVSMGLNRHRLSPPIGEVDSLASIPGTGDAATPGNVQLSTTQIDDPVVDNTNYAYWLTCNMDPTASLGLWGATVEYTVSGARGAGA